MHKNWSDTQDLPKLERNVPIMKLLEMIPTHLRSKLGIQQIPLYYVTIEVIIPPPMESIRVNNPCSTDHSRFHEELIARASHDRANFQDDSAAILDILVAYLEETEHMTSLKPFQRLRDGRGALLALEVQNLGSSKWDGVIRKEEQTVLNFLWNGKNTKYTLGCHIIVHRAAHNNMVHAK